MQTHMDYLKKRLDQLEERKEEDIIRLNEYLDFHMTVAKKSGLHVLDSSLRVKFRVKFQHQNQ